MSHAVLRPCSSPAAICKQLAYVALRWICAIDETLSSIPPSKLIQLPECSSNNIPKYQCPRCTCRTCSLPCYKRHQKWSQCSGKRDQAAYVKRSRLCTASGIDHDYNFLTGIERAVANADRHADSRGIDLEHGVSLLRSGQNLQQALDDSMVKVHRAPKGMSRQKANNTRLSMYAISCPRT